MSKFLILVVALCLYLSWDKYKLRLLAPNKLPSTTAKNTQVPNCLEKKQCAVIYVAPWCPSCDQMAPQIQGFLNNSLNHPEIGVKVIIGQGRSTDENEQKAQDYRSQCKDKSIYKDIFIDSDSSLKNSLGVNYYPTFMVVNTEGRVEKRDQNAWKWMHENLK
ncbi:MAG: TlpA family protein disulfide reductase [Bacteriovoracaceae bacterium]